MSYDAATYCSQLLAGLADAGVRTVFISPGSRNTPLTMAAIAEPRIDDLNIRDERSAGFMAVGIGKQTGVPAAVICTSGSAATHYFPAVVEADQSTTPLIVLTSDRPQRLRGTGAPQTMDQVDLYGRHVTTFLEAPTGDARSTGVELVTAALADERSIPGPVHMNLPFDEPLVPSTQISAPEPVAITVKPSAIGESTGLFDELAGKRVMVVAGGRLGPGFSDAVARFAASLDAPILADPQVSVDGQHVIDRSDLLVAAHDEDGHQFVLDTLAPEVIVRFGPLPTSKPIWRWMETSGIRQIRIERSRLSDPLGSAAVEVDEDPVTVLARETVPSNTGAYSDAWRHANTIAGAALLRALGELEFPNEAAIARIVAEESPVGSTLFLASSRPIRDVDAFARRRADRLVLANRGVNGIDGTISTAIGAALGGTPTTLLIGDIAFLHDATAVAEAAAFEVPLRIVVINNDGGGIFSFLPQATSHVIESAAFERHWGTPHGLAISPIARSFGLQAWRIDDRDQLIDSVSAPIRGPELIEVVTDRARVVSDHEHLRHAVADALGVLRS